MQGFTTTVKLLVEDKLCHVFIFLPKFGVYILLEYFLYGLKAFKQLFL